MGDCVMFLPLRQRGEIVAHTMIDAEDFPGLVGRSWRLDAHGYAIWDTTRGQKRLRFYLSRVLMGLDHGDPRQVDHINRNPLDNRRANLRVCTHAENHQNLPAIGGSSAHRGVSWSAVVGKWEAKAQLAGVIHHLGYYELEEDAAKAASEFRRQHMPFAVEEAA